MDENLIDENIRKELHYRLIMVKYTSDDPVVQAYMLSNLKKTYEKHNIKMSEKMKAYIFSEVQRISSILSKQLEIKKKEFNALTTNDYPTNNNSIFSDEELNKYKEDNPGPF